MSPRIRLGSAVGSIAAAALLLTGCWALPAPIGTGSLWPTAFCTIAAGDVPPPERRARDRRPRAFATSSSTDADGIRVDIESDASTYTCTQPITVTARVSYVGDQQSTMVGAEGGSLVQFGVREMDGPIQTFPDPTTGCTDVTLSHGDALAIPFFKSGQAPGGPPPDAEFGRAYYADRTLNLPVGTWEIFALGTYVPAGCDPAGKTAFNRVSVVVTITG